MEWLSVAKHRSANATEDEKWSGSAAIRIEKVCHVRNQSGSGSDICVDAQRYPPSMSSSRNNLARSSWVVLGSVASRSSYASHRIANDAWAALQCPLPFDIWPGNCSVPVVCVCVCVAGFFLCSAHIFVWLSGASNLFRFFVVPRRKKLIWPMKHGN